MRVYSTTFTQAAAASATDIWELTPAASRPIRIHRIIFTGIQTSSSNALIQLIKRSTAATGGTQTAATIVDQGGFEAAVTLPTTSVKVYTANPTTGTLVGIIRAVRFVIPASNVTIAPTNLEFTFTDGLELNPSEYLVMNLNGATLTGNSLTTNIEFSQL